MKNKLYYFCSVNEQKEQGTRLNKYLSEAGYCSRREADRLTEQGKISVNGTKASLGTRVFPGDLVKVKGVKVGESEIKSIYLAFNKPVGIVCTSDQRREKNNIIDYINYPTRIYPIGRLDKQSEGLILLTNDGEIVNKILRARYKHEKEYIVVVNKPINSEFIESMKNGVPILDTITRKCFVEQTGKFEFRIILTQGLNRQIRRMCEYLGYEVKKLKRTRIMNIKLNMPIGKYRELTSSELTELNQLLSMSQEL